VLLADSLHTFNSYFDKLSGVHIDDFHRPSTKNETSTEFPNAKQIEFPNAPEILARATPFSQ
jgi:hypothetical protein